MIDWHRLIDWHRPQDRYRLIDLYRSIHWYGSIDRYRLRVRYMDRMITINRLIDYRCTQGIGAFCAQGILFLLTISSCSHLAIPLVLSHLQAVLISLTCSSVLILLVLLCGLIFYDIILFILILADGWELYGLYCWEADTIEQRTSSLIISQLTIIHVQYWNDGELGT